MKRFLLQSRFGGKQTEFDELTAPPWLKEGGVEGSTMCNRWFWEDYVLTLDIGKSVETDFTRITRVL